MNVAGKPGAPLVSQDTVYKALTSEEKARINEYFVAYLDRELNAVDESIGGLSSAKKNSYIYNIFKKIKLKAMEIYWSVTRMVGRGYLHDGTGPLVEDKPIEPREFGSAAPIFLSPRIYIDCTPTFRSDAKKGMQRVVRNLAVEGARFGAMPVTIANERLDSAYRYEDRIPALSVAENDAIVYCEVGPVSRLNAMRGLLSRQNIGMIVYDLIPLLFPATQTTYRELWRPIFEAHLAVAGKLICISRATAQDVIDFARLRPDVIRKGTKIGWMRLGSEPDEISGEPSAQVKAIAAVGDYFLAVGTLEPRKGHHVIIDAFERIWREGRSARLVIVGRRGWRCAGLERRIVSHPEFGERLLWLNDCPDADLDYLYSKTKSLIFASFAEGYGLPLIEAARRGAPLIASDISVFREICGSGASYFALLDPEDLSRKVGAALAGEVVSPDFPIPTWRDAAQDLLMLMRDDPSVADRWIEV